MSSQTGCYSERIFGTRGREVKRPNYNAAKRARELKQKAKRDAKLARKQSRVDTLLPGAEQPSRVSDPAKQDRASSGTGG